MTATLASVIDIDSIDAFSPCANGSAHGPAYGRVIVGPSDVRRLCHTCTVSMTGSGAPAHPPSVGYINGCYLCDLDACRVHGGGYDD